ADELGAGAVTRRVLDHVIDGDASEICCPPRRARDLRRRNRGTLQDVIGHGVVAVERAGDVGGGGAGAVAAQMRGRGAINVRGGTALADAALVGEGRYWARHSSPSRGARSAVRR